MSNASQPDGTDNYNTAPTVPPARWSHPDQTWVFDE